MVEILKEFAEFNTSQRLADQVRLILKKGWYSDLEIQEIFWQVNSEKYIQSKPPRRVEILNFENQTIENPSIATSNLT